VCKIYKQVFLGNLFFGKMESVSNKSKLLQCHKHNPIIADNGPHLQNLSIENIKIIRPQHI